MQQPSGGGAGRGGTGHVTQVREGTADSVELLFPLACLCFTGRLLELEVDSRHPNLSTPSCRRLLELEGSVLDSQDQVSLLQARCVELASANAAAATAAAAVVATGSGQVGEAPPSSSAAPSVLLPHMACSAGSADDGTSAPLRVLQQQLARLQVELANAVSSKQVRECMWGGALVDSASPSPVPPAALPPDDPS